MKKTTPTNNIDDGILIRRRTVLKVGMLSCATLLSSGLVATQTGCSAQQAAAGFLILRPQDLVTLSALTPAIIGLPPTNEAPGQSPNNREAQIQSSLVDFDAMASRLSPFAQKELMLLFNLLAMLPARWVLTGSPRALTALSQTDITQILSSWRDSSLGLKRKAYLAITRMTQINWYSSLSRTSHTGYPGPNAIVGS
ncbi:Uncharacterised protein [BD1-7 clade bacterium]|uniref:Twin-arginine translocation pathway signal protein n=1 Tax=BD1-7 clade bacterium TaxID=2029982 RepID=A0A5S9QSB0_9GAMM|nr:Uncharacterised protein [BD1-7 clade bacterium]CAA0122051.1 Uncharacterised protein [BD1-7 clade bacterium]